jgi:hypothetical protein
MPATTRTEARHYAASAIVLTLVLIALGLWASLATGNSLAMVSALGLVIIPVGYAAKSRRGLTETGAPPTR